MVKIMENPIKMDDLGGFPFWIFPFGTGRIDSYFEMASFFFSDMIGTRAEETGCWTEYMIFFMGSITFEPFR